MGLFAKLFAHRAPQGHGRFPGHGHGPHAHGSSGHGRSGAAHGSRLNGIPTGGGEGVGAAGGGHVHGSGVMSHAGSYDRLTRLVTLGRRDRIYAGLADLSGVAPGDHAVDLGCGTGALTRALAARIGPTGLVTGIDPSSEMVAFASREATSSLQYAVHSAEALPFPDASVQVVATALAMHHIDPDRRPVAVAEAWRVLVPGGRLLVVDMQPPRNRIARYVIGAMTGPEMANNDLGVVRELIIDAGFELVDEGVRSVVYGYVLGRKP